MKVVVIIPARYGSTRFEAKPLALIAGKPMIQRVYERAAAASSVTGVAVATDDERIVSAVEKFGGQAVMTSDACRSGTDRVFEAGRTLGLTGSDIVVNVQGDQPVFAPECIDEVTAPLIGDPGTGMTTLAFAIVNERELTDPKDVKMVFDQDGWALYFSRATIPHDRDGNMEFDTYKHLGVYAYTMDFLAEFCSLPEGHLEKIEKLEQLRALEYGLGIKAVVTAYDSPEVDLPEDIARIEALLKDE
ncbi:3-deoxy-manno-octulosonate cytidylyltransferase (CMP-KDO synthetase) [Desulfatibacillum alkenivorans DSM 16219]|jgi:3-deoxy-manno-octulosonate cytidylyltransferase (CMP-KDO synthetase)|uniref:3-deoxy-manno-octulosonate cytidylyltransferase n=1 Tax=Desulfatibacillum alkenivorans DSM 16219 TaxID=1121393 RepID=A0A1M6NMV6_9BACT|nr:3-deoxy-manno-octulosonate cytidylyltransferase [Desulfatibacillum alkenivorans]SHJ97023.1 3-deoxy-manno-octulosonate cytidylyltransferase (CMP-KDO synthetase) [Desulfatibacillum alkenivorans DSM 16219]